LSDMLFFLHSRYEKFRHGLDGEVCFSLTRLLLPDAVRRVFHETRKIPEEHDVVCDGELKGGI